MQGNFATDPVARAIWLLCFAVGTALGFCLLWPMIGRGGLAVLVLALASIEALRIRPRNSARLHRVTTVTVYLVHFIWLGLVALLGPMLAWSVPAAVWVLSFVLALMASLRIRVRVPPALALGVAVAALVTGWMREDGVIRCDDYLRIRSSAVAVVVPTTPELERCVAGASVMAPRYPRRVWEFPDGDRFLVTTQRGTHTYSLYGDAAPVVPNWFDGGICEVNHATGERPRCFDDGKSQGIAESVRSGRVYAASHNATQGTVYALPLMGPFEPILQTHIPGKAGEIYVDDEHDVVGAFDDEGLVLTRLRASDLAPLDTVSAPFLADGIHYDQRSHQGILCAALGPLRRVDGHAFASAAFTGAPFSFRPLAPSSSYPSSWLALTWGCDWDPVARRAWVAVASLGLLEQVDYDTGAIVNRTFIGFGARAVAVDPLRRRVYVGFFLNGNVLGLDIDSGAVVDRWFAGRFLRQITLARDQESLLVASNVGVLRIPLVPLTHP